MLSTLSVFEKKKDWGKNNHSYIHSRLLHIIGSMATQQPICHLTGDVGRKPQQRGRDSQQAPDVDFLLTETLPSCLFPPLLWRCHFLHGASNHLYLCSLRQKERNTWRWKVWEGSSQQTSYHLSAWSSVGELMALTSHRWLPSRRTDPVSLQHQHDSCENLWKKQEMVLFVTYLRQGRTLAETCLSEHRSSALRQAVGLRNWGLSIVPGKAQHCLVPEK